MFFYFLNKYFLKYLFLIGIVNVILLRLIILWLENLELMKMVDKRKKFIIIMYVNVFIKKVVFV